MRCYKQQIMEKLRNCVPLILVFSQLCLGSPILPDGPDANPSLEEKWQSFKKNHNRQYANEAEEVGEMASTSKATLYY